MMRGSRRTSTRASAGRRKGAGALTAGGVAGLVSVGRTVTVRNAVGTARAHPLTIVVSPEVTYRVGMGRSMGAALASVALTMAVALAAAPVSAATVTADGITPRVVNGQSATAGQFPFAVALIDAERFAVEGAYEAQFCGGSLTTPTTVVTAAHCLVDEKTGSQDQASSILVAFGGNLKSGDVRIIRVSAVAIHPAYDAEMVENDVAVITLSEPVTDIPIIMPMRPSDISDYLAPGATVFVMGWGNQSTTGSRYPESLRLGGLRVFPDASCGLNEPYTINVVTFDGFDPDEADPALMVCAAGVTSAGRVIDACQGDSGGPLVGGVGATLRLVGVVSWGEDCGTKHPGVYTRISAMTDFLLAQQAISTLAPTLEPGLSVEPLSGALRVTFAVTADGSVISTLAATATDPATGAAASCFAEPRRDHLPPFCTISGLANGVSYALSGISANPLGNSPPGASVTAAPAAVPIPGAIRAVSTAAGGRAKFRVDMSDGNGGPLDSLRVDCAPVDGGTHRSARVVAGGALVTRLAAQRYSCTVVAVNSVGEARSNPRLVVGRR